MVNTTNESKRSILFHETPPSQRKAIQKNINITHTKERLEDMVRIFDKFFSENDVYIQTSGGVTRLFPARQAGIKFTFKSDYVSYLSKFLTSDNLAKFINTFPDNTVRLVKYLLRYGFASEKTVCQTFGMAGAKKKHYWERGPMVQGPFQMFCDTCSAREEEEDRYGYTEYGKYVYIKKVYDLMFRDVYMPQPDLTEHFHENLEDTAAGPDILRFSNEENLAVQTGIFDSLFESGQVDTSRDTLLAASVKRIAQLLKAKEFFDDQQDKFLKMRSATLLVNALHRTNMTCLKPYRTAAIGEKIRQVYISLYNLEWLCDTVLKDYSAGLSRHILISTDAQMILSNIASLFRQLQVGKWIDIETCQTWIQYEVKEHGFEFYFFEPYELDRYKIKNKFNDKTVTLGNSVKQLTFPFINSFMFLLAALGFVEVAYQEPDKDSAAWSDNLRYIRLTRLGAYAMKLTDGYEFETVNTASAFSLDDERLYVKVTDSTTPYLSILDRMGQKISHNLYKVSYESFLSGCGSKKDIESQIEIFKSYIAGELPRVWADFFQEMKDRCTPMQSLNTKYKIMQVHSADRNLLRILTTHPQVREHTVRAEGCILLVETDFVDKLKAILKQNGYLL